MYELSLIFRFCNYLSRVSHPIKGYLSIDRGRVTNEYNPNKNHLSYYTLCITLRQTSLAFFRALAAWKNYCLIKLIGDTSSPPNRARQYWTVTLSGK